MPPLLAPDARSHASITSHTAMTSITPIAPYTSTASTVATADRARTPQRRVARLDGAYEARSGF